eukprot:9823199-Prorocentrum_lima.AAC.1
MCIRDRFYVFWLTLIAVARDCTRVNGIAQHCNQVQPLARHCTQVNGIAPHCTQVKRLARTCSQVNGAAPHGPPAADGPHAPDDARWPGA